MAENTTPSKRLSAFAFFKSKKSSSLSDVQQSGSKKGSMRKTKAASTNASPIGSGQSSPITLADQKKLNSATKKKEKADLKKVKKLLKNVTPQRQSFLPDNALNSPLNVLSNGHPSNVEGRSFRPRLSNANLLPTNKPLKATPEVNRRVSMTQGKAERQATPPVPPKKSKQLTALEGVSLSPVPGIPPRIPLGEQPPRPPKRKRLSHEGPSAASPPAVKRPVLSPPLREKPILSPPAIERTEPLPAHPRHRSSSDLPYMYDSVGEARKLFECMIHPVKPDKFFSELWEKKPLLVKRHISSYNDGWFSTAELDQILRENVVNFSEHLDVVSYTDGKRETHNPHGRAYAPVVWDYYQNGCSVRLLNPQTYSKNVWRMLSTLQEYFGTFAGANVYLTPPGTQGFAPHYDDIEAFILQLEGRKHWKLYSPRTEGETLPRFSSNNFTEQDLGEPILDVLLEAGDILYFPRGTIHQGKTIGDQHSLHITVSCCQKSSWGDLLETLVPRALQIALDEDVEFRQALPRNYLNYMGIAFADSESPQRTMFIRKIEQLFQRLISYAPIDAACDQRGKNFVHESLPPVITNVERSCSIHGTGEKWLASEKRVVGATEIEPDHKIKLIRKGVLRLVSEEENVSIYHNMENSRIYKEKEPQFFDVTPELAPAVEYLLLQYPKFVKVDNLPLETVEGKVEIASILYDKGLLITDKPIEPIDGLSDEES